MRISAHELDLVLQRAEASIRQAVRATPARVWLLAFSGWLTLIPVCYLDPASSLAVFRAPIVFAFVLVCPGLAVARLLPLRETVELWVVGAALSVSFGLLVTLGFTLARNDSTTLRLATLAAITTAATLVDVCMPTLHAAAAKEEDAP